MRISNLSQVCNSYLGIMRAKSIPYKCQYHAALPNRRRTFKDEMAALVCNKLHATNQLVHVSNSNELHHNPKSCSETKLQANSKQRLQCGRVITSW